MLIAILFLLTASAAFAEENESRLEPELPEIDFSQRTTLNGGWYPFEPYMVEMDKNGVKTLAGMDYELVNLIARNANVRLEYKYIPWDTLLDDLKTGKENFATSAIYSKERAKFTYYSLPYRYSEASIFLPRGKIAGLADKSVPELVDYMQKNHFKLAVVKGYLYSSPIIDQYITDPANQTWIIKTNGDNESLDLMLNGDVDGFLADRIVGSHLIWHANTQQNITEYRLRTRAPTYIIFSKKSVSQAVVDKFNESIQKIKHSTAYHSIISWYLYPAIVFQIRNAFWFKITELIGTVAFALSGLLIAYRERTTLFGAIILAILPSLGGGLIRDVIFGRNPVGALQSPIYLSTVLLTVLIGFIIIKILSHYRRKNKIPREIEDMILGHAAIILTITDALGLATFTVIGVMVSLLAKASPLWLWGPFFAFVTGAGGGILRDMLSKSRYIEALEGDFYGELAIIWGFLLSMYILLSTDQGQPEYIEYAVVITIVGVFVSRLLVHFMRLPNITFKHLR
ncbi:MAG: TRIC cation channel family protein [Gammaproteobacteria bacterium]